MAKNKENKMKAVTSSKCKPKTHLKDVNGVFRSTDPDNKKDLKNNQELSITRSFYTLRSHRQNAVTELFDKTKSDCSVLELSVCTEKNINMSSSTTSCVNRNDQTCNLRAKQKKQPEGKESGRQKYSGKKLIPEDSSISVTTDCDNANADTLISNFSNLSLSRGTQDIHSMPLPPVTESDLIIQREDGNGSVDSWRLGNFNHNPDGNVKRKMLNEIDIMSKNIKKKKRGTKLLRRPECIESYLCTVKRKSVENHEIYNNKKKNKCESVERNMVVVHTESTLEARHTEIGKTEHEDVQLSKKNEICSADLITVINKIMYSNHDKPNLKFYPDMFLKCTSQPSACTSTHVNDGSSEMEENKAVILKSLMKAKMWASAFNNFYTFLTSENYLPTSLLRLLFHFIMSTSDTLLMNKAVEIIACHWDMHPPCRENMRKHYINLLTESETADKDLPIEVSNDGLLYCILNMLESALESPDQNRIKLVRAVDFQDLSVQPVKQVKAVSYQEMLNRWQSFDSFENNGVNKEDHKKKIDQDSQQEDEQYLTSSEQIERLLLALELITELMERDMAVWLVKYSVTPFKYVRQNSCCPLIGKVDRTTTKQVLKLYHLCRQHRHSRILARFIGLLAEVARVSEIQDIEGKGLIQYPYFSTECCLFVEDVYISFVNSSRTADEKLELLGLLQPAWVRMFVSSHWLNDNLGHNYGHDLECTIKILQSEVVESELFRNLSVENSLEAGAHVEEMWKSNTVTENPTSEETRENKKSVPSRKRKKKKASISDVSEETIHILIIMTASYIKTYCLQEVYDTLKYKDLFANVIHNYSGQDRKGRVKLRFNYVQIVNDIQNYRELKKVLKSLCENTQVCVFHSWLSVFCINS